MKKNIEKKYRIKKNNKNKLLFIFIFVCLVILPLLIDFIYSNIYYLTTNNYSNTNVKLYVLYMINIISIILLSISSFDMINKGNKIGYLSLTLIYIMITVLLYIKMK